MRCTKCGHENDADAAFCEKCGTDLKGQSRVSGQTTKILVVVAVILVAVIGVSAGILLKSSQTDQSNSSSQISEATGFPLNEVPTLASEISKSNGAISSVNYGSVTLDQDQCIYILARAIVMIDQGEDGNIPIKSIGAAPNPYGHITSTSIARNQYVDMASRMCTWMDTNGQTPNFIGIYSPGQPDLSPTTALNLFSKALAQYGSTGELPATVNI